eukprot:TRINITY_DN11640_c0_g1_i1.p1 TRINITY_DN11640_c0_g1~~TRINITY_DN11640_c0_g1_i1.p1  ORF type:complete len:465 (-),score=70.98 TRINITY_DN11640_c0_g1_i1:27-1421(-)
MSKQKRKYTSKACDFCKGRHIKCDGEQPCFQCVKKKLSSTCHYSAGKKRGPKARKRRADCSLESASCSVSETYSISQSCASSEIRSSHELSTSSELSSGFTSSHEGVRETDGLVVSALSYFNSNMTQYYPHGFVFNSQVAVDFIAHLQKSGMTTLPIDTTFHYSVMLAHGFLLIGNNELSDWISNTAQSSFREIVIADADDVEDFNFSKLADDIASSICLLIDYQILRGRYKLARRYIKEAYNFLDQYEENIKPEKLIRIFSYLSGSAYSTSDMNHWVKRAKEITYKPTVIDLVFLCFFHCSPGILRDDSTNLFPEWIVFPENPDQANSALVVHYQQMIDGLQNAENALREMMDLSNSTLDECSNVCNLIINGCRSIVYALWGNHTLAFDFASKALEFAEYSVCYTVLGPLAIAYSLKVLLGLKCYGQIESKIRLLDVYSNSYPCISTVSSELRTAINTQCVTI